MKLESSTGRTGGGPLLPGLPSAHLWVAPAFLLAGSAALLPAAPAVAAGAYGDPRAAAAVHLFALGWITTSIVGVLYHLLPAALGGRLLSRRLGWAGLSLYAPGVALFSAGLGTVGRTPTLVGAALLAAGLLPFVANLAVALWRAPERDLTWWCLAGAGLFLLAALVPGALLSADRFADVLGPARLTVVGVHLHIAAAGWILLPVVGVGHRLLPSALGSEGVSALPGRAAALLLAAGAATLTLTGHLLGRGALLPAALLLAAGAGAFVLQAALHFRRRVPTLTPGTRLAGMGVALLALAAAAGLAAHLLGWADARLNVAYGILLFPGALALFTLGHFYLLFPAFVRAEGAPPGGARLNRARPGDSGRLEAGRLPAAVAALLLGAGVLGLAASALAGWTAGARLAALAYAGGAAAAAGQLVRLGLAARR